MAHQFPPLRFSQSIHFELFAKDFLAGGFVLLHSPDSLVPAVPASSRPCLLWSLHGLTRVGISPFSKEFWSANKEVFFSWMSFSRLPPHWVPAAQIWLSVLVILTLSLKLDLDSWQESKQRLLKLEHVLIWPQVPTREFWESLNKALMKINGGLPCLLGALLQHHPAQHFWKGFKYSCQQSFSEFVTALVTP